MLQCRLCSFRCTFRTTMDSHLRDRHMKDNPLDMLRSFDNERITGIGPDCDVDVPDASIIDSSFSGGGGDFGGGGASSDY